MEKLNEHCKALTGQEEGEVCEIMVTASASKLGFATARIRFDLGGGNYAHHTPKLDRAEIEALSNAVYQVGVPGYVRPYLGGSLGWVWANGPNPYRAISASDWEAAAIQREGRS